MTQRFSSEHKDIINTSVKLLALYSSVFYHHTEDQSSCNQNSEDHYITYFRISQ